MASGLLGKGSSSSLVDIRAFMDSDVPQLSAAVLDLGCLLSLGTTRDGGAVSITITHEGEWDREYFRDSVEASDWLRGAAEILRGRGLVSRADQPPPVSNRRRGPRLTP
jgi:hypothetical protein